MSPRVSPRAFPLLHLISQQILLSLPPPPAVIPTLPQLSLPCGDFLFGAKPQGQHCKHGAGFSPRGEKGGGEVAQRAPCSRSEQGTARQRCAWGAGLRFNMGLTPNPPALRLIYRGNFALQVGSDRCSPHCPEPTLSTRGEGAVPPPPSIFPLSLPG